MFYTFCPECGQGVGVDGDGCCLRCGALAVGEGVKQLAAGCEAESKELEETKRVFKSEMNFTTLLVGQRNRMQYERNEALLALSVVRIHRKAC